ncbi:UNVERIFIED_CONTAM: Retrovirus-related Pol polyprotein from transposon TNT 1-94 [Sesamum radiatum]|uniref:Retrovirus-related Pol polyprotein from transposon TNT 1-94 n=1 Tax=Sesamum radiatum TaxID=300843 RepID=A0AAW2LMD7_SESRA
MTNEIQKQYDRLEDVPSIMLRMKDVYAVPDRHIRYAATKAFSGTKMTEGSSVQSHGITMLSLVEKLEDLKAGLNNDTYIDVILQSLPPSYDPFIVNYNMNGLEKEASTSKAKGKGARCWKRKKGKGTAVTATASTGVLLLLRRERAKERSGVLSSRGQMMCAFIAMERGIGRGSVHNSSPTQVLQRSRKLSKDEMVLRLGDGNAVVAEAVGSLSLVVRNHVRIELKDCYYVSSMGKITKKPFVGQSAIAKGLLDLVHTDVCGPLSIPATGGFSYFINFTDDHSWYGYVYLMSGLLLVRHNLTEWLKEEPNLVGHGSVHDEFYGTAPPSGVMHLRRFVGYLKETAGYYFYDPTEQKIFVSRNAVFLEKSFPSDNQRDEILIEESSGEPPHDSTASFEPTVHTDGVPILHRSTRESRVPERYGFVGLTSQLDNDPKTYGEAMSDIDSDKWLEAMKSEMDSMGSNEVWTLVDPPKGVRPVGCKLVYKRKLGADREVTAFKARLVVKGYTQRLGVDFQENYSPVAMAKSIRIVLAIAAWYDYKIWQIDVKTAFLNGFIEEEIFIDQPEGFTTVGEEQKVCRLQRSIYGLKQAFRSWNTRFDEVIRGYDFIKNDYDPCVYKKISGSSVAYLVLYVDDILLIGNDVKMLGDIKAWLSTQFSMKDMDEASYILGIKIYRDRSKRMLGLTQSSYIENVLKRFRMEHSKQGALPMRHRIKLSKKQFPKTDEELKRMSDIPYASAVGSIQYVVQCTRPDVAYAFSVTSRYQACTGEVHWSVVKNILKCLRRTKDMFLIYGGGELILEGYSYVSFQSDDGDAKSQSGYVFKLNGGVVAWNCSK